MPPPDPCFGCKFFGSCCTQGLVNRLAMWEWLDERGFECADFVEDSFHGIEGVLP